MRLTPKQDEQRNNNSKAGRDEQPMEDGIFPPVLDDELSCGNLRPTKNSLPIVSPLHDDEQRFSLWYLGVAVHACTKYLLAWGLEPERGPNWHVFGAAPSDIKYSRKGDGFDVHVGLV